MQKLKRPTLFIIVFVLINFLYYFTGAWQRLLDEISYRFDLAGGVPDGWLLESGLVAWIALFAVVGAFIMGTKYLVSPKIKCIYKVLIVFLLALVPVYYTLSPAKYSCYTTRDCTSGFRSCCGSCDLPKEMVNKRYKEFMNRLNFCSWGKGKRCPMIGCIPTRSVRTTCLENKCGMEVRKIGNQY